MSTMTQIKMEVAAYFGIPFESLADKTRKGDIVKARQIAIYSIKDLFPGKTLKSIASEFGTRDHSDVLYAIAKVEELMFIDRAYSLEVKRVLAILRPKYQFEAVEMEKTDNLTSNQLKSLRVAQDILTSKTESNYNEIVKDIEICHDSLCKHTNIIGILRLNLVGVKEKKIDYQKFTKNVIKLLTKEGYLENED